MSFDPFAKCHAYAEIAEFVESLAADLRDRRSRLETALRDLLFVWDMDLGRYELASRFAAVGKAVRDAGLADEVQQFVGTRGAKGTGDSGSVVAFALMGAATRGNGDRVAALLAMLDDKLPNLKHDARARLARIAKQLLVIWCDRHAADYPARFRDEIRRLDLDFDRVEQWNLDRDPDLTDATSLVLDVLLSGMPFAVDWLSPPADFTEVDEADDSEPPAAVNAPFKTSPAPTEQVRAIQGGTPGKKSKGKMIDARMLKTLTSRREALGWTAAQWAQHLDCAESTVKETRTWTEHLKAVRAGLAVEHARKMDRSRLVRADRHNGGLDDDEFDDRFRLPEKNSEALTGRLSKWMPARRHFSAAPIPTDRGFCEGGVKCNPPTTPFRPPFCSWSGEPARFATRGPSPAGSTELQCA